MLTLKLILALIVVESGGDNSAIGDHGRAYGPLQIHQAVVTDVNRIHNTAYTHRDMFRREMAITVCMAYLRHYGRQYTEDTGEKPTPEIYARIWNGGPKGWTKQSTEQYWERVKRGM